MAEQQLDDSAAPRELDLSDPKLEITLLPGQFGVIRLGHDVELPRFLAKVRTVTCWYSTRTDQLLNRSIRMGLTRQNIVNPSPDVPRPPFLSITRTLSETSIVVSPFLSHDQLSIAGFPTAIVEGPWRAIALKGPLALSGFVGTMHRLTGAIKQRNVPVFAMSTYDT